MHLLKCSHLRVTGQRHKNLIRQEENLIYSRSDPLFEQKLELATEGLEPYFLKHLKTKISPDNALVISKYVLSMKTEAGHTIHIFTASIIYAEFYNSIQSNNKDPKRILCSCSRFKDEFCRC